MDKQTRHAPLDITGDEFRELGYALIDRIGAFLDSLPERPVTRGETPSIVRASLKERSLPARGQDKLDLLEHTASLMFEHSLFNSHPKFLGYITSPAAPIGILADLLASATNPNCGAWILAPMATEIEKQTVQWLAEMIGYPSECGGILVSGGNAANFVCFLVARHCKASWNVSARGFSDPASKQLRVYGSAGTHTWIQKAADMYGLGADSVRWIKTDRFQRIDVNALHDQILRDRNAGDEPFMVVGTAGSVATGSIDDLPALRRLCDELNLWFHVDGAYGAFAAALPESPSAIHALATADSVALDPHKWLYAPLEAGCALVRDSLLMRDTFTYHPDYYKFDELDGEVPLSFVDYGPQNSRGFRALKVWLQLSAIGRDDYLNMIRDDIALAKLMYEIAEEHLELEAFTHSLSIATYRFRPREVSGDKREVEEYLNKLNSEILSRMQNGGEAFVSNAVVDGIYLLRACIVNFRTQEKDIREVIELSARLGREVDCELRPQEPGVS